MGAACTMGKNQLRLATAVGAAALGAVALWLGIPPSVPAAPDPVADGRKLYVQHCLACHGEFGDGNGPAARFLYPRPRNFGEAKFRLASTKNSIPTDADLLRVITRGMPGSGMIPFGHLSETERQSLVAYVRDLTRTSFIQLARRDAEERGDKVDPAELDRDAAEVLKPGEPVALPTAWPTADAASVTRGKALYVKSCAACHGDSGKGDGVQEQKNLDGTPTAPRDFTRGIFKSGRDREQLYARIALGMAGTPMPASQEATQQEVSDLVHFIQSLSSPDAQALVEHKRQTVRVHRVQGAIADPLPAAAWEAATPVRIVVSPLWWRNYAEPELTVRALHDGRTIVVRLNWRDASRNDVIAKPEDFEDMAALQFYRGVAEPFLGMGAADAPSDLWLWRATWRQPRNANNAVLDEYPFDTAYYRERAAKSGKPIPDFQTARAAGNPHARGNENQTASSLAAKGFGTTTFRPKASQLVTAQSSWADGKWTVELRRPLAVGPDGGVNLEPGSRTSVAFAIWDGAAGDRNGQKLVSIWHDLKLDN